MRIAVFKRKARIQDTVKEMLELESIILDAISHRGNINDKQRATVLKNVVEKMKKKSSKKVTDLSVELVNAEKSDDILKSIML